MHSALPRLCLLSAKGLRQDALGGRLTECEGALSIRVTCVALQSPPMTAFPKKRSAGLANPVLQVITAEWKLVGHSVSQNGEVCLHFRTILVIGCTDSD